MIVCTDAISGMSALEACSVHMVMTSPPYDAIRDYHGGSLNLSAVGHAIKRILVDGGVAIVVLQDQTKNSAKSLTTFRTAVDWCDNAGLRLWECLIWNRSGVPGAWWSRRFRVDHEYVLVFLKGNKLRTFSKEHMKIPAKYAGTMQHGGHHGTSGRMVDVTRKQVANMKCPGTVMRWQPTKVEPRDADRKLKRQHPATFPQALVSDMVCCFTQKGDTIVDPFCGSGSTLVECKKLGRAGIGYDISAEYCEIAQRRLAL